MNTLHYLSWLLGAARPYAASLSLNCLLGILRVGAGLCFVAVCKHLVDIATGAAAGSIALFAAIMVGCRLLQLAFGATQTVVENRSEVDMRNALRSRLHSVALKAEWLQLRGYHSADLSSRLNEDVSAVSSTVCRDLPYVVVTLAQLVGALAFFMYLDVRMALVVAVVMPLCILGARFYTAKMRRLNRETREVDTRLQAFVQESFRNSLATKVFSRGGWLESRLAGQHKEVKRLVGRRTAVGLMARLMVQGGFMAGYAVAFIWSVVGLSAGRITFGAMTAFLQLVGQVQHPMVELSRLVPSIVKAMTSVERVEEVLALQSEPLQDEKSMQAPLGVRLMDVEFAYPDSEHAVFDGFGADFAPQTMTAVVGPTGAGKTTLFRLILALVKPSRGTVQLYNSIETVEASASTRCNITYVPQGNSLVSGTVRDNLLWACPAATDDKLRDALVTACADFVLELPDGLDTLCGEGGASFSEGQAQRIAIARALLREAPLVLLDEPTSALDLATGHRLMANLREISREKTIIVITHSADVAQMCENQVIIHQK